MNEVNGINSNIPTNETTELRVSKPVIVSASRATDIPAFYSDWLQKRIQAGYVKWKNPFNGTYLKVSFENTRLFVFWSKNPKPMLSQLTWYDDLGFNYYFQYTLNNYEKENWESRLPTLQDRLETFMNLSERIGKEKVIWRFDPIIIGENLHPDDVLERIQSIGDKLHPYTNRLVFSFIDIENYKKVKRNLNHLSGHPIELDLEKMQYIAKHISIFNNTWNLDIGTCSEAIDLKKYEIEPNRCVDDRLIVQLFREDKKLMQYIGYVEELQSDFIEDTKSNYDYPKLKDKGQRKACGCIQSKDIGQYDTCPHGCVYCYANTNHETAEKNWHLAKERSLDTII